MTNPIKTLAPSSPGSSGTPLYTLKPTAASSAVARDAGPDEYLQVSSFMVPMLALADGNAVRAYLNLQSFVLTSADVTAALGYSPVQTVAGQTGNVLLQYTDVAGVAPSNNASLTGTPTATTPAVGDNGTRIATTAFVVTALAPYLTSAGIAAVYAPLASPALTGIPTAPTAAVNTVSTQIATTSFVVSQIAASVAPVRGNLIINGAFEVDQRRAGTAYTVTTTPTFGLDRWWIAQPGTAQCSATLAPLPTALAGFTRGLKILLTGTSTSNIRFGTIIESADVARWQGKSVYLTFRVIKGSSFAQTGMVYSVTTGTGADQGLASYVAVGWTGTAIPGGGNPALTTAWQTIRSNAIPIAANVTELAVEFTVLPTGAAVDANSYLIVTGVEIREDALATNFEARPYALELALCQRFYEKSFAMGTVPAQNAGTTVGAALFPAITAGATIQRSGGFPFKVTKRVAPTMTFFNPNAANAEARDSTGSVDCSATAQNISHTDYFSVNTTGNAATVANNRLALHWTADAELV